MTPTSWSLVGGILIAALSGITAAVSNGSLSFGAEWTPVVVTFLALVAGIVGVLTPRLPGKPRP